MADRGDDPSELWNGRCPGGAAMMVFDQRQQEMLENMELEILDFVASAPMGEALDDLKRELEHFGFSLGSA
ncbi:MAG TPA: hypothetical protein VE825_09875 [Terriglobales bacterium]|jgi:hypothetical protein|nr:hypothetical protein [Terriglobales bacterium]